MIVRHAAIPAFLFVLLAGPAPAAVFEEVARDFAPLAGYVVAETGGEFLIDRDAADGIAVGDLFSVVRPGEKIVHPVTGKELGTLDRVKGFLQVTRIRTGYSHARPLDVREEIARGDVIRRFELVPAAFVDTTGRGKAAFDRLRAALPGLEWREGALAAGGETPALPEGALMAFVLGRDRLEVRGPDRILRAYGIAEERPGATAAPEAGAVKATPGGGTAFAVRGDLPEGTVMADFVRDGDRLLLAVTEGTRIEVFAVGDNLVPVAAGGATRGGRVHALHWWQPRPDASPLLAATMAVEENRAYSPARGETVTGSLFALGEGRLAPIREEIPYLLGSFDRDGDGIRETLLGQSFDRDTFFGSRIRELRLRGEEVAVEEPSFPVSRPFSVQGALFVDLTGDGRPETVLVRSRTLVVYDRTQLLYESSRQMGGSLSVLTYDVNPGAADRLFTTAAFEVPPVAVDLDGDGRMEVVVIASEGSAVSGIGSGVQKSWLATLSYRDGRFVRGSLGPELEIPLQGLHASREGLYVVATPTPSLFKPKRPCQLLFLPWNGGTELIRPWLRSVLRTPWNFSERVSNTVSPPPRGPK